MGSGDRIKFYRVFGFGFGISFERFPFALTMNLHFLMWVASFGFGRAYDAPPHSGAR